MIYGMNNYIAVELTEEPGIAIVKEEKEENNYVVFYKPNVEPIVFTVDNEEIAFIHEDNLIGKLQ